MANPGDNNYLSTRDGMQVLRAAFDDTTKRLRVDAVATIAPGGISAAAGDNIAVANQTGTEFLAINPDGSINAQLEGTVDVAITAVSGDNIAIANPAGTRFLLPNADGSINVDQNTSPWVVSGTVTSNIGTTGGLALDSTLSAPQGSVTGGTAGTKSELAGAVFNTVAPTLTNGQQASLQLDSSGNLKTTATVTVPGTVSVTQGTTPWVNNITQFGSNPVITGTGASGVGIPRVTVSNDSNILATQSGTWSVTANAGTNLNTSALALDTSVTGLQVSQSSTTSGEKGPLIQGAVTTAAPSYTTGQTNPLSLTTSGALRTDSSASTQPVSGTVTANAGTNLNTSALALESGGNLASIKTNTDNLNLSQGSTTSGQKGNLSLGAVTTAAPTYTTGQSDPLSLTTAGALRTDSSGSTQPVSGTVAVTQSTSPWVENVSQFGGSAVVTGTGTSGAGIPRVTVSSDSSITANAGTNLNTSALALSATQTNGNQKTQIVDAANATVGPVQTLSGTNYLPVVLASSATPGAAVVARSVQVAGSDGTNAQTISTDTSGKVNVNAKASTPTAGTVTQAAITVGTSAVRATVSGSAPSATRSVLLVSPDSASTAKFYMGASSVTNSGANRGFQLLGGDQVAFNSDAGDYYIISDTAGQTVYITEQA